MGVELATRWDSKKWVFFSTFTKTHKHIHPQQYNSNLLFSKVCKMRHVVLLSPPDVDDATSKLVCQIGSNLSDKGFSVSVDQWSRREQCNWGPLPWLHSQLLELNSLGGRVLLVLTRRALERTEEWMHWNKDIINESMGNKENDLPKLWSPYSDLFTASLSLIQADKLLDRAGKRFVLVKFDSHPRETHTRDRCLPELLQGLPLFSLPSQNQSLLAELTVTKTERGSYGGRWGTPMAKKGPRPARGHHRVNLLNHPNVL